MFAKSIRIFVTALMLLMLAAPVFSQGSTAQNTSTDYFGAKFSLTPVVGYQLNNSFRYIDGDLDMGSGMNFGGIVSVNAGFETDIEVAYTFYRGNAHFRSYTPLVDNRDFDMAIHYIQLNGIRYFTYNDRARPFGLLSIGAAGFVPENLPGSTSAWSFAFAIGAGVKIMFSEHVGIRLQGRMLLPFRFSGFGIYGGTGGGGVTTFGYVNTIQGDFSAGLVLAF